MYWYQGTLLWSVIVYWNPSNGIRGLVPGTSIMPGQHCRRLDVFPYVCTFMINIVKWIHGNSHASRSSSMLTFVHARQKKRGSISDLCTTRLVSRKCIWVGMGENEAWAHRYLVPDTSQKLLEQNDRNLLMLGVPATQVLRGKRYLVPRTCWSLKSTATAPAKLKHYFPASHWADHHKEKW